MYSSKKSGGVSLRRLPSDNLEDRSSSFGAPSGHEPHVTALHSVNQVNHTSPRPPHDLGGEPPIVNLTVSSKFR